MDVPSWHPANVDAQARQLAGQGASASQRTEFKLMPGSSPDTSTEAGRELLNELTRGADGGSAAVEGRGFFDSSDRLYLQEQRRLEAEELQKKRDKDRAELLKFRSTALKVQAEKAAALVAGATDLPKSTALNSKSTSSSVATVVIKTKKRAAPVAEGVPAKSAKQLKATETTAKPTKQQAPAAAKAVVASGASLLVGYSSSDSDGDNDSDDDAKEAETTEKSGKETS